MDKIEIIKLKELPVGDLQPLVKISREEGFEFVERLVVEYLNGKNRFEKAGEALLGVYSDKELIAIGGLNRDPYVEGNEVARVRHLYVLPAWRNKGIGKQFVEKIIFLAKSRFRLLTLRTFSEDADRFYRAVGFQKNPEIENTSHHLLFAK